ncbi:MAG: hypothetical protein RQ729_09820 [Wenzhouxiangellaceae bacterium]|nr:hypothetical protein [Wenzhouxiangellaceae bacterium]
MNRRTLNQRLPRKPLVAAITASLALAAGSTSALEVTGSFSGWWDQPAQTNHGLILTVSRLPSGEKTAVAFWAHFDGQGRPSWLFAQGPIVGDTIEAELYSIDGVTFMQANGGANTPAVSIGTMQITFSDCDRGEASFATTDGAIGSGTFDIARLTAQPGVRCSGGISDDKSPAAAPEEFTVPLLPTDLFPGAKGKAEFEFQRSRSEFDVEIEDLPVGDYQLLVGGISRGTITVARRDDETEGELEFSAPRKDGELLLDFDPRDQLIEIVQAGTVVLEGAGDAQGNVPGMPSDSQPEFSEGEIKIRFNIAGGRGKAELEQERDRTDFDVEIEDVPPGNYALVIGGVERGTIVVVDTLRGPEGELEFRFPPEPGKLPLDFDPRGATIEITANGTTLASVEFPLESTESDDDGDDSDDDGNSDDDDGNSDDDDGSDDDDNGSDDDDGSDDDGSDDDGSDDNGSDDDGSDDDGDSDDDDGSDDDDDDDDDGGEEGGNGHGGGLECSACHS